MDTDAMDFEHASQPRPCGEGMWEVQTDESWQQGRTIFGGLVAANLVNAMQTFAAPTHELRTLSTTMAAPVPMSGAIITAQLDRVGKSTSFVSATITNDGTLCTRASAVFAASRSSKISVPGTIPTLDKDLESAEQMPYIADLMPAFLQHFSLRFGYGDFPYSGSDRATVGGYCRYQNAVSGVAALIALLDVWPPPILPMTTEPIASSTVQWTAHLVDPSVDVGADWFDFGYHTVSAHSGYSIAEGTLSRGDKIIGWTEQLGAVFG